jgi:hypothetical protein
MNFLKIKLLVIAVIMFAASSVFASPSYYDVTVNTNSLAGTTGYLYLDYNNTNSQVASTATVSAFTTDGTLGAQDTVDVTNGNSVNGTLPSNVVFANTGNDNDYNQAIAFGNSLSFLVSFASTTANNPTGSNTLSLSLFGTALGGNPLLNTNGGYYAGTVAAITLNDNGSTSATSLDASTAVTPTPIPGALYLLGSGLMGLVGMRRKKQI